MPESSIDRWIALADKKLRGLCQDLDCERLAEISDPKTSLAYCAEHYINMRMDTDWLYRRIDQCREMDANTYVIEG
jgi:hypothetical protein